MVSRADRIWNELVPSIRCGNVTRVTRSSLARNGTTPRPDSDSVSRERRASSSPSARAGDGAANLAEGSMCVLGVLVRRGQVCPKGRRGRSTDPGGR